MAIYPELLPFLSGAGGTDMDEIELSRAAQAGAITDAQSLRGALPRGLRIHDEVIRVEGSHDVGVRIYRRSDLSPSAGALLYIHGGAFIFGSLDSEHDRCIHYAIHAEVVVISVDYRLAPEFPYPAAIDDVLTSLLWLHERSTEIGVDVTKICVGGASAGGSLAAGLALRCRDQARAQVKALMLLYPVLDDRGTTMSMETFDVYHGWDGMRSRKMWPLYLGHDEDAVPYAAPARADDLSGLPVTFIMSCEEDPQRDEDLAFAQQLLHAGVSVELHHYRGTFHGFDVVASETEVGRRALSEQVLFLESVIGIAATA